MQRWRGVDAAPSGWGRSVVTIGVFDGVHRGHQQIIGHTVERARQSGISSVVVTFDPHPSEVVRPGSHPAILTESRRKAELMEALGLDVLCVIPFTLEFSRLSPETFVHDVLVEHLHASTVVVGENFRFGHKAAGDVALLERLGRSFGFTVEGAPLVSDPEPEAASTGPAAADTRLADNGLAGARSSLESGPSETRTAGLAGARSSLESGSSGTRTAGLAGARSSLESGSSGTRTAAGRESVVSSTYIRSCVDAGDVEAAATALGRPHRLEGVVVRGDRRGRELGFPTANLMSVPHAAVPADGVYAAWLHRRRGEPMRAAVSIGTNPTFNGRERRVEAYVLDFSGDLYGERLALDFVRRLRETRRYDSIPPLVAQIEQDVADTRTALPSPLGGGG